MPCRTDGWDDYRPSPVRVPDPKVEGQKAKELAKVKKDFDKLLHTADHLTHELDVLRDAYLELAEKDPKKKRTALYKRTRQAQIQHRKEDLARAQKELERRIPNARKMETHQKYIQHLAMIHQASPYLPLIPQLGFDPDIY